MDAYNGIFHVTSDMRIDNIGRRGLRVGSPMLCTDKGKCAAIAEDEYDVLEDDPDVAATIDAENLANRVLNERMPEKFRKAGANREAIYFFPNKEKANIISSTVAAYAAYFIGNRGCVVEVSSKKIPCRSACVVAPAATADRVFAKAANVSQTYDFEEDEEAEDLDKTADDFWEQAQLLTEVDKVGRSDEIFCPCNIPPEAIRQVHGCPVKRIGKQYTLHAFVPRQRKKKK